MDAVDESKRRARAEARERLARATDEDKSAWAGAIVDAIRAHPVWVRRIGPAEARPFVMAFLPMADEPDITPLWAGVAGVDRPRLCVPRVDWRAGTMAPAEVADALRDTEPEPGRSRGAGPGLRRASASCAAVPAASVGLVLVPGLAFAACGVRLGRGGGFYDRFLAGLEGSAGVDAVGVCFACQVVPRVPAEAHDRRVGWLATEAGVRRAEPEAG